MEFNRLTRAMIHVDWRDALPNWLWVDPGDWRADRPPTMPPVPVIAIDDAGCAVPDWADVAASRRAVAAIGRAIDANPASAAALVHCLRAASGQPPAPALLVESLAFAALQGSREHVRWLADRRPTPPASPGDLIVERRGSRLDLRIDRADARNAIDRPMRDALFDAFVVATVDESLVLVRLTAAGRCFSVGADLAEFGTTRDPATAHLMRARTLPAWPLLHRHWRFEVQVQGACMGAGLELVAFADRLTATSDAWFQLPELAMGILPGFGGTVSLSRRIGRQRAAALMLSGRRLNAPVALAIGLIDAIVDDPAADDRGTDEVGG